MGRRDRPVVARGRRPHAHLAVDAPRHRGALRHPAGGGRQAVRVERHGHAADGQLPSGGARQRAGGQHDRDGVPHRVQPVGGARLAPDRHHAAAQLLQHRPDRTRLHPRRVPPVDHAAAAGDPPQHGGPRGEPRRHASRPPPLQRHRGGARLRAQPLRRQRRARAVQPHRRARRRLRRLLVPRLERTRRCRRARLVAPRGPGRRRGPLAAGGRRAPRAARDAAPPPHQPAGGVALGREGVWTEQEDLGQSCRRACLAVAVRVSKAVGESRR
mmetsp:Transcript_33914/g.84519  ORF Transcript_33914/g.84519 Transcript_33914/m.84519 type:complete len:271 (-) Transcript_33914:60-872(-)